MHYKTNIDKVIIQNSNFEEKKFLHEIKNNIKKGSKSKRSNINRKLKKKLFKGRKLEENKKFKIWSFSKKKWIWRKKGEKKRK